MSREKKMRKKEKILGRLMDEEERTGGNRREKEKWMRLENRKAKEEK